MSVDKLHPENVEWPDTGTRGERFTGDGFADDLPVVPSDAHRALYQREQELRALAEGLARGIESGDPNPNFALAAFRSVYPANETEGR